MGVVIVDKLIIVKEGWGKKDMVYAHTVPSMSIGGVESISHRKSSSKQSGPGYRIQMNYEVSIKDTKDRPTLTMIVLKEKTPPTEKLLDRGVGKKEWEHPLL